MFEVEIELAMIIPAAGASSRFGEMDKLAQDLGGRTVLQRTIELFAKRNDVQHIIVAGPHDGFDDFKDRFGATLGLLGATLCKGGVNERWETVQNALELVPESATHVGVHDGARPLTPPELIDRVLDAATRFDAVIPAVEVSDTLKRLAPDEVEDPHADPVDAILGDAGKANTSYRAVGETVPRAGLAAVQTPQVFQADLLRRAYQQADLSSTDDAGLVERLGEQVVVVEGDPRNLKITRPADLQVARALLKPTF